MPDEARADGMGADAAGAGISRSSGSVMGRRAAKRGWVQAATENYRGRPPRTAGAAFDLCRRAPECRTRVAAIIVVLRRRRARLHRWKAQRERRPLPLHAPHPEISTHPACEVPADREPESAAGRLARVSSLDLYEWREDRLQLVARNADPGIAHAQEHEVPGTRPDGRDSAMGSAELPPSESPPANPRRRAARRGVRHHPGRTPDESGGWRGLATRDPAARPPQPTGPSARPASPARSHRLPPGASHRHGRPGDRR